MVAPDCTPVPTVIRPSALIEKPAGAPTRASVTVPAAGGDTPLSESLASTLVPTVLPGAMLLKLSSPATRVPLLMVIVAVVTPQTAASGAGRQTW